MVMDVTLRKENEVVKSLKKEALCPKCKVEFGHRVHRGFLFKTILSWVPAKRYYCYKCKRKHYVFN